MGGAGGGGAAGGVREVGVGEAELLAGAEGVRAPSLLGLGLLGAVGGVAAASLAQKMAAPRRCRVLLAHERGDGAASGNGAVVGYIVFERRGSGAHLCELAVREGSRRRGWGRALLTHALELLDSQDPRPLFVSLRVDPERSPGALQLYESAGFVADSRQPDYYGPGRDALYMLRDPGDMN